MGVITYKRGHFRINLGNNVGLLAEIKKIPEIIFDEGKREWVAPTNSFVEVKKFSIDHHVPLDNQAQEIICSIEYIDVPVDPKYIDLEGFRINGSPLMRHQKQGIQFLINIRRAILADDMGLGKTVQALIASKAYNVDVIVICPASLIESWKRESAMVNVEPQIISWSQPKRCGDPKRAFVLIADEAHYAQSGMQSIRGRNFINLAMHPYCKALFCLTGTPMKNGQPINLFPLLQSIRHPVARNGREYHKRFCDKSMIYVNSILSTTKDAHLVDLHNATKDVILRRVKDQCLDLPPKIRIIKPLVLEGQAQKGYERAIGLAYEVYKRDLLSTYNSSTEEFKAVLNIRIAGSIAKAPYAIEMAQELIENGESVVIFTEFIEPAKIIGRELGVKPFIGETSLDERTKIVDRFQAGYDKVFVATIKAGGVGLTLTKASNIILVDRPYTAGDALQAEDRCYRIGQSKKVMVFWLSLGIADEIIDENLKIKAGNSNMVIHGNRGKDLESHRALSSKIAESVFNARKKIAV